MVLIAMALAAVIGGLVGLISFRKDELIGVSSVVIIVLMVAVPVQRVTWLGNLLQITVAVMILFVAVAAIRNRITIRDWGVLLGFGSYIVCLGVATAFHNDPDAWRRLLLHAAIGGAALLLGLSANEGERRMIARSIVGIAAAEAAYACYEFVAQPPPIWPSALTAETLLRNEVLEGADRAQGTLGHPLPLAVLLICGVVLARDRRVVPATRFRGAILVLFGLALLSSGSRSALVVVGLILLFTSGSGRVRPIRGAIVSGAVLVALQVFGAFQSSVVDTFLASGSLRHRTGAIDAAQQLVTQPWPSVIIGNGYNSTLRLFQDNLLQTDGFYSIDNQFVASFAIGGIISVVLLSFLVRRSIGDRQTPFRLMVLSCVAMFFAFEVLAWPSSYFLLFLSIGVSSGAASSMRHIISPPTHEPSSIAPANGALQD